MIKSAFKKKKNCVLAFENYLELNKICKNEIISAKIQYERRVDKENNNLLGI